MERTINNQYFTGMEIIMYAIKDQNERWFTGFKFRSHFESNETFIPVFNPRTVPDFSRNKMMLLKLEEAKESIKDLAKYKELTCTIMEIVAISTPLE